MCSALYHTCGYGHVRQSVMLDVFTRVGDSCNVFISAVARASVFNIVVFFTCVGRRC